MRFDDVEAVACGDAAKQRELGTTVTSPATLSTVESKGRILAHIAANNGQDGTLRVLHEQGAAATLEAVDAEGSTPAHDAAFNGHAGCLRVLHELGAAATLSAVDAEGRTPAHYAALYDHAGTLRALHELGAAATLLALDVRGWTPAHDAAQEGHDGCLRVLHELLNELIDPQLAMLQGVVFADVTPSIRELDAKRSLSWSPKDNIPTPAQLAADAGHSRCFDVLVECGGAAPYWSKLAAVPGLLVTKPWLLSKPSRLDLPTKRAWLGMALDSKVGDADGATLSLVVRREHVLLDLCRQLGVDEATGQLTDQAEAQRLDVRYRGEAASGDALRREWFGLVLAEMLDPDRGLFVSLDGNRTLQPNPDSASTAGPDHLSYFALLGRIAGLALYHRETLDASWSTAFLKATFGFDIAFDDLQDVDPKLYENLAKMQAMEPDTVEGLCLTFVVDNDEAIVYDVASKRRRPTELKPGGEDENVTAANLNEYLQLYAQHKLVGAIHKQLSAFREGLGVFVDDELRASLRKCCTVADIQLLLCGVADIDLNDWKASTRYRPEALANSPSVAWFWAVVSDMSPADRARLLYFCTGSARVPATGFGALQGFNGAQSLFTLSAIHGAEAGRLPTASACFNTLYLPAYSSRAVLEAKLRLATSGAEGFHEAAVAV